MLKSLNKKLKGHFLNKASANNFAQKRYEYNYQTVSPYIAPNSRVLDVGAFTCRLGELLANRLNCQILNLDVADYNETSLPFMVYNDLEPSFPIPDSSFDVIIFLYVLHHASDDWKLLQEAKRVCSENGVILVAEDLVDGLWDRTITIGFHLLLKWLIGLGWSGKFRPIREWEKYFSAAGLKIEKIQYLGPHLGQALMPKNVIFVLSVC